MTLTAWLLVALVVLVGVSAWAARRVLYREIERLKAEVSERPNLHFTQCRFDNMKKPTSLRLDKVDPGCKALLKFRFDRTGARVSVRNRCDIHEVAREYADKLKTEAGNEWAYELRKEASDVINFLAHGRRLS